MGCCIRDTPPWDTPTRDTSAWDTLLGGRGGLVDGAVGWMGRGWLRCASVILRTCTAGIRRQAFDYVDKSHNYLACNVDVEVELQAQATGGWPMFLKLPVSEPGHRRWLRQLVGQQLPRAATLLQPPSQSATAGACFIAPLETQKRKTTPGLCSSRDDGAYTQHHPFSPVGHGCFS